MTSIRKSICAFVIIILYGCLALNAQKKSQAYLCAFMDGKSEDLRYCISTDGYHFTQVYDGNTILRSTVGGKILRDPQIIQDKKGVYHLIATNAWKGRSFAVWDSRDLISWQNERLVTISPADADKTWAPEAIYNEKDDNYVLYWTSSLNNEKDSWSIYYATTEDFVKFSDPRTLMRTDQIILDANIVKFNDQKFYMFYRYKNQVWRKEADQLLGVYRDSSLIIDANVEGPYVYNVAGKWNMIWDYYGGNQGRYGMAQSPDLKNWKWLTDKKFPYYNSAVNFPPGVRHGSVISIETKQLKKILKAYPNSADSVPRSVTDNGFVKGADIGWLQQMEATGYKFYNDSGKQEDCFRILKDHGINTIRLRTWVNPSDNKISGHNSKDETIAMAVRAKKWGMRVMVNFHYSDSWADPGKQKKPAAWEGHNFPTLLKDVYEYTYEVMTALKKAGVKPEWVQVGNETPGGMIYPEGSTSNWPQLAQLINKGYDAVKAVSPQSKVILHLDRGNDSARFVSWFDNARKHEARYDIIGLSYYPWWLDGKPDYTLSVDDLGANMNNLVKRYGKEVMVVEVGGEDSKPDNTYDMLIAVQDKVKAVPNGKGLGVIYWEPQGARSWSKYPLSA